MRQGDAERGDVEDAALDGGADRAGVVYAESLVAAVVDAGDEQVGLAAANFTQSVGVPEQLQTVRPSLRSITV